MSNEITLSERQVIKINNNLNSATYKLSELSLNIIMTMVTEIDRDDKEFKTYKFSLKELEEKMGKKINRSYLDGVSDELLKSIIKINKFESKGFIKTSWISSFDYSPEQGKFEISFDPKLKPYLLSIQKNFVLGYLKEFIEIKGEYSKRIYMILREHVYKKEFTIDVNSLKSLLVVPQSMNEYKVLKNRVIKQALKEINLKTNLEITLEEERENRKVKTLNFKIKEKWTKKQASKTLDKSSKISSWANKDKESFIDTEIIGD